MSPTPNRREPVPATNSGCDRRRSAARRLASGAALLAALAGCAQFTQTSEKLARQVAQIGCISRCQTVKDQCDSDARVDYQQCQAGYQTAQRDFRWCNAASEDRCGYPWWTCSENLYGYCTNRYWECHDGCRRTRGAPDG